MALTRIHILLASLCATALAAADDSNRISQYAMSDDTVNQWKLPGRLREISGLALSPDGRLFAVADEEAVVFEIDYDNGGLLKAFAFGDPVFAGDFEGIAWLAGQIYLVTSDGILYAGPEGGDGEHVAASRVDTRTGKFCEIEGLASGPKGDRLFFACKGTLNRRNAEQVHIIVWSTTEQMQVDSIEVPISPIKTALHVDHFNPSGMTIDLATGNFIIVAARQKSLLELTVDGQLVAVRRLRMPTRHRQPEGIELTADGRLVIADEGGDKKARLAVYEPRKGGEGR
jgi:uncharacterized protein YjiK